MKKIILHIKQVSAYYEQFISRFRIQNESVKKIVAVLVFLIALQSFYSYIGIYKNIQRRPCGVHAWAQCERASIAQGYYKEDMNFFLPRVQRYSEHGGVSGVEFPVIYYMGAVFYKVFGFNEIYLRLISLILVSIGLFFFYLLSLRYLKSIWWSLAVVASALFSPVLLYYTPSFLPDAPGMGLVLMAWYFFFKYKDVEKEKYFNWFVIIGTLAALIKVVSFMCFAAVVCLILLDRLKVFKNENKIHLFKNPLKMIFKLGIGTLVIFSWYYYANWLSKAYENEAFCLTPVTGDANMFEQVFHKFMTFWAFRYYSYETYVLMISAILCFILCWRHVNKFLFSLTIIYLLGSVCYVILFIAQFINHDYYLISILPMIFFLFLCFADALSKFIKQSSALLNVLLVVIIFFNMKECLINCEAFYTERYDHSTYYGIDERPYYDLEPRLRAIGIQRNDVVMSGFDDTFCNTLYLMDQVGLLMPSNADSSFVKRTLEDKKIKFLILNDSTQFNKIYRTDLDKKIVLTHRGLIVYKLR